MKYKQYHARCHALVNSSSVHVFTSHEGCKVFSLAFNVAEAGCRGGVVQFGSGWVGSYRVRSGPLFFDKSTPFATSQLSRQSASDDPTECCTEHISGNVPIRVMRCSSRTCVFCECSWYGANFRVRTYFVYVAHPVEANVNICVSVNPKGVSDIRARASHT